MVSGTVMLIWIITSIALGAIEYDAWIIFPLSILGVISYYITRAGIVINIFRDDGILGFLRLTLIQVLGHSLITAVFFYIGLGFSKLFFIVITLF